MSCRVNMQSRWKSRSVSSDAITIIRFRNRSSNLTKNETALFRHRNSSSSRFRKGCKRTRMLPNLHS